MTTTISFSSCLATLAFGAKLKTKPFLGDELHLIYLGCCVDYIFGQSFPLIKCLVYIASKKIQCVHVLIKLHVHMGCVPNNLTQERAD